MSACPVNMRNLLEMVY